MIAWTTCVYGIFALASFAGGVVGFRKAKSRASLIAGCVSGCLLLGATCALSAGATMLGLCLGGGTSLLLAGRFVPAFAKTKKAMPQGMMAVLSLIGIGVTLLAFFGQ
jgi:uncharacterized membrane protein (UPF0136 family)